jgi:geranylgeranyl diphosphate synthase type I
VEQGPLGAGEHPEQIPSQQLGVWLHQVQHRTHEVLEELLELQDETALIPSWHQVLELVRSYSLRPSKRLRPGLVLMGHALGREGDRAPAGLWRFAAATELLHTFMLIHDDVADRADTRRGGASLHRMMGPGGLGQNLAIVIGDHLFSRAVEVMLGCGLPGAHEATRYFLQVCRHTAAGQYMDIHMTHHPLQRTRLRQVLRVARLKTALYGFTAPLVCGAKLAGAQPELLRRLERLGRYAGTAYQLRDDLLGLYGKAAVCGKPTDSDVAAGKRTFPVLAAWVRAPPEVREEMERLWTPGPKDEVLLEQARELVEAYGGRAATERLILRLTHAARRVLFTLTEAGGFRAMLGQLLLKLVRREV